MLFKKKLQQQIAENTSNKYVIHCMKIMLFLMIGIWILNILNVFPINKKVVSSCMVSSLIFFTLGMILWHFMDLNKKYVKYLIILWTVIITTIMETGLTFHAILASVLPILFCSLYCIFCLIGGMVFCVQCAAVYGFFHTGFGLFSICHGILLQFFAKYAIQYLFFFPGHIHCSFRMIALVVLPLLF